MTTLGKPTARQSEVDGQETVSRESPASLGTVWVTQVEPPSVVAMIAPPSKPGAVPTATQSEGEAHETPLRSETPLGSVWVAHVVPPSVVAMGVAPTATQSEVEAHKTPVRYWTPLGTDWATHFTPPSVVVIM